MLQYLLACNIEPAALSSRIASAALEDARNIYDIFCSARLQIEIYDRPENGREQENAKRGSSEKEKGRRKGRRKYNSLEGSLSSVFIPGSIYVSGDFLTDTRGMKGLRFHLLLRFLPFIFQFPFPDKHFDGGSKRRRT